MAWLIGIAIVLALALLITWIVGLARAARAAVAVPDSTAQEKKASNDAHKTATDRATAVLTSPPGKLLSRVDQLRARGRAAKPPSK